MKLDTFFRTAGRSKVCTPAVQSVENGKVVAPNVNVAVEKKSTAVPRIKKLTCVTDAATPPTKPRCNVDNASQHGPAQSVPSSPSVARANAKSAL